MKIVSRLLSAPLPTALLTCVISFVISMFVFLLPVINTNKTSQYYEVYNRAAAKKSIIERELYARIDLNQALASHIEQNPNLTQSDFSGFVSALLRYEGGIVSSMSFEKDMIITLISPFDFNKKALGLDLTVDAVRKAGLEKCVKYRKAYIEGPRELAQDNLGIVSYIPVLSKDTLTGQETVIGVADVVILWDRFLKKTGLDKADEYLDIAIRGKNGTGEAGDVFYGDSTLFSRENVIKIPIELQLGEWVLAASPKAGWVSGMPGRLLISCIIISVLIALVVYFILSYRLKLLATGDSKLKFITENSNDVIWIMDYKNLKYKYVSNSVIKLLGWTTEEFLTNKATNLLGNEACVNMATKLNKAIEEQKNNKTNQIDIVSECQITQKNGTLIWIETTASLIINSLNEYELVGRFHNINKRKEAELQLKQQLTDITGDEQKYHNVLDKANDMVWVWAVDMQKWTFINQSCYDITGFTTEEMLQQNIEALLPANSIEILHSAFASEVSKYNIGIINKIDIMFEMQRLTKSGNMIWTEVSATGMADESDNVNKIIGVERVIENRKQAELMLQESNKQYHFIADNLPDVVWIADANTLKYQFITDNCINLTGYTKDEYLNMTLLDNIIPATSEKVLTAIENAITLYKKSYKPVETIFEVQRSNHHTGSQRWIEVSAVVTANSTKEIVIIGVSRFVNERKKAELQLQKQQIELQESEKGLRHILEYAKDLIWTMDMKTMKYTYVSDVCLKNTGFTKEEHENMTIHDALPPESCDAFTKTLNDAMELYKQNGQTIEDTLVIQRYHKNGSLIGVEISVTATNDFTEIIGIERIIEERKKAEEQAM